MGCDGGTIPKRHELIKKKEKKEEKDKRAETAARWRYCAASSNNLVAPIVSCELGRLYNKDVVVEYLLNKDSANSAMMKHIRNLKDIIQLKLTRRTGVASKDAAAQSSMGDETNRHESEFVCPISNLDMNGQYKFYVLRSCGCVFSDRAFKQIKTDVCLVCNKPFTADDLIVLNGTDEEIKELEVRMHDRRARAKEAKKSKRKVEDESTVAVATDRDTTKKAKTATTSTNGSTSASNFKASAQILDKKHKNYTVEHDPNASEAYKSLFTSHQSAKSKPKAPWVTFNPMYN